MEVLSDDGKFPISWRTNAHGHIARNEYSIAKPSDEFRIGLVGDSFTANVTNTIRWGDVLEDRLNDSLQWREITGPRYTRVINFGLDGIGTVQFDDVVEHMVLPFEVDLLIVNLLRSDVARRPYYRGDQGERTGEQIERYAEKALGSLPWWSAYPEVLAVTLGHFLALTPRLNAAKAGSPLGGPRHFEKVEEAVAASADALRKIRCNFPAAMFLVHPAYWDYQGKEEVLYRATFEGLVSKVSDLDFIPMMNVLPRPSSRSELDSWFNVPHDLHNSDLGLRVYGEAVATLLLQRYTSSKQMPANAIDRERCSKL
jgi:hypothetical protein